MQFYAFLLLSFLSISFLHAQEHRVTIKEGETTLDVYSESPGSAIRIEKVSNSTSPLPALHIVNRAESSVISAVGVDTGIVVKAPLAGVFDGVVSTTEALFVGTNLNVGNSIEVNNDLIVFDKLSVAGDIAVVGEILCAGDVEFREDLSVERNLLAGNSLVCQGDSRIEGDVTALQDFTAGSSLFKVDFSSRKVGIGTISPNRELHILDTNSNGDAIAEFTSSSGNLIIGMNISSGGLLGTTTNKPLRIRTNNQNRMVITNSGNIGFGRSTADYRVDVSGDIRYSGTLRKNSDRRYKKDIKPIEDALMKINKTRGVSYRYRTDEFADLDFNEALHLGFIAQELELLFPELVSTDTKGYKSVDYPSMTAVLVQAMNEQQMIIDELKNKNEKMEQNFIELEARFEARLAKLEKDKS